MSDDLNKENIDDRATRRIMGNIDFSETKQIPEKLEKAFEQVVEKYITPYYETVDRCNVFRDASRDIGIQIKEPLLHEIEMKRLMDELTGSMDLIRAKTEEIFENIKTMEEDTELMDKSSTEISLEDTIKLNEAFALTEELTRIIDNIEQCMREDDEDITPIAELYNKQVKSVETSFVEKLNDEITNLIVDSKIQNLRIQKRMVVKEKVTLLERMMGKNKLKAAQNLHYETLMRMAEFERNEDLGAKNIGESVSKLYEYISSIPDKYCTQGIADLIEDLSESEACTKLIKQAKADRMKKQDEQRARYERGEEDGEEEKQERVKEEKSQKELEDEFNENALTVVERQNGFFKPYRKEAEELLGIIEALKREEERKQETSTKKKEESSTRKYVAENAIKEVTNAIQSRIKDAISCLYSKTSRREKVKEKEIEAEAEQEIEESER